MGEQQLLVRNRDVCYQRRTMTDPERERTDENRNDAPTDDASTDSASTDDGQGVESTLARLEEIVAALENEDVSLERSLALFEEGVGLADQLKKRLEESELRVKQVIEDAEGFRLEDFDL